MPFEWFLVPGIIFLVIGFLRGLSDYKQVTNERAILLNDDTVENE